MHVGPPILLFSYFTISLQIQYCRGRCLGLAARDAKKFSTYYHVLPRTTTYYHVLQQNIVFASRTANLACRPSYSTVLLFYYFTADTVLPRPMFGVGRPRCNKVFQVLPRTTAERSFCISDGQPRMSALLFYFFTNLLFYFFTPRPRCKKRFFISDGQPCMSALLFYCFTNLLLYYLLQIQYCRGRCLGLAARDAKKLSTYYHVLQQNVVFASRTANLACRPLFYYFTIYYFTPDTVLPRPMFGVGPRCKKVFHVLPRGWPSEMQKLCGGCLRLAVRKKFAADVCGWLSEMQKSLRPMFAAGCPRCKKL